jgi:hypothetical protein
LHLLGGSSAGDDEQRYGRAHARDSHGSRLPLFSRGKSTEEREASRGVG